MLSELMKGFVVVKEESGTPPTWMKVEGDFTIFLEPGPIVGDWKLRITNLEGQELWRRDEPKSLWDSATEAIHKIREMQPLRSAQDVQVGENLGARV